MTKPLFTSISTVLALALAALLTLGMLAATNTLARHQYRVAKAAQQPAQPLAAAAQELAVQSVTVVGHRPANT